MGICKILCKLFLILINLIFLILGLVFFIPGVMMKAKSPIITDLIDPLIESMNDAVKNSGYVSSGETIDIAVILDGLSTGLIVLGSLLIILTMAIMIGSCCLNIILIFYAVFVGLIIIAEAVLVGMVYMGKFDQQIQDQIQKTITDKYISTDSFTVDSFLINFMHLQYKCCGVDGYKNFVDPKSVNWKNKRTREITVAGTTQTVEVVLATPISCCKMKGSFPSVEPVEPETCAIAPTVVTSNFETGCWPELEKQIKDLKGPVVGGFGGLIAFELALVILAVLAFILTRNEEKQKVGMA